MKYNKLISIIIPIRNEVDTISKTLDSIINQTYPITKIEILISDGMSNDGTRGILMKYQKKHSFIKIIDNPESIVPTGFNRALSMASGQIIIRIDGHAYIEKDFIEMCIKSYDDTNADCVGGLIKNSADGIIGDAINYAQSSKFGVGNAIFRQRVEKGRFVDTLAFGAYQRHVFSKIGGYDEELIRNQDDEFNFRLLQNGGKIWLDPSIKSTYYPRNSIINLFKQYLYYGFYKVRVMQKRRGFASWRHLVPSSFILSLLLASLFYFLWSIIWPLYLIVFSYTLLNFVSTLFSLTSKPKKLINILVLPLIYFCMHIAYGFGFLSGIFYFIRRWNDSLLIDHYFDRENFEKM